MDTLSVFKFTQALFQGMQPSVTGLTNTNRLYTTISPTETVSLNLEKIWNTICNIGKKDDWD